MAFDGGTTGEGGILIQNLWVGPYSWQLTLGASCRSCSTPMSAWYPDDAMTYVRFMYGLGCNQARHGRVALSSGAARDLAI